MGVFFHNRFLTLSLIELVIGLLIDGFVIATRIFVRVNAVFFFRNRFFTCLAMNVIVSCAKGDAFWVA